MKFILFVVAVVALLWLLRRSFRRAMGPAPDAAAAKPPELQAMLACAFCGLHLPRDEALPGRGVVFCSEAHRRAFEEAPERARERAHPPS